MGLHRRREASVRRRHEGREPGEDGCGLERRHGINQTLKATGRRGEPAGQDACKEDKGGLEEADRIDREITALLAGDGTYECLVTIPGIGPRTASELVIGINIEDFPDHDHLASYCGIAPRNRQSGTSISSVSASRQGNRRLKNLLIFSCSSLVRSENRFGEYYRACRGRGMCHGEALKAVARKRLKVIYAIMRDKVPYSA